MLRAKISDKTLKESAAAGAGVFFAAVAAAVEEAAGGLTAASIASMSAAQTTLLAYKTLREELMTGGFIQLIHNGYGAFIFVNPFAKALRAWGVNDLASIIQRGHKLYNKFHVSIEQDADDEEFMALYEQYPAFDVLDDEFVEMEEKFTAAIAFYIDAHLDEFVEVTD